MAEPIVPMGDDGSQVPNPVKKPILEVRSADQILLATLPEPVWAIPGILPVGLCILAGAPKVGKSVFALQATHAVASGGEILGVSVRQGPVLYIALEDSERRLKDHMSRQSWSTGLRVDFLIGGAFRTQIGDLKSGGSRKLSASIRAEGYRLVVIDTLSRAVPGDQNDVAVMTASLGPLQEAAQSCNAAVLLLDHHSKAGRSGRDMVADVLGSTGKSAVADTVMGLYRDRGKAGARLAVTGRDVEEHVINMSLDSGSHSWQVEATRDAPTQQQGRILAAVKASGSSTVRQLAATLGINPGTAQKSMARLEELGRVRQRPDKKWEALPISTT